MKKKSPDEILSKLGLTADEVRLAFNVSPPEKKETRKNYLFSHGQKKIRKRIRLYENLIFAKFIRGMPPKTIAHALNVSEETVRLRLRKAGFFN